MLKLSTAATPYYPASYLDIREDVHMPEAINGDQRQVVIALAQVVQGVREMVSVSRQEVDPRWADETHGSHGGYCEVLLETVCWIAPLHSSLMRRCVVERCHDPTFISESREAQCHILVQLFNPRGAGRG